MDVNLPEVVKASELTEHNPLIDDLRKGEPATLFFLSDRNYWMRDAHSAVAISRVIPWGLSQINIRPILAKTARLQSIPQTRPRFSVQNIRGLQTQDRRQDFDKELIKKYAGLNVDLYDFTNEYIDLMIDTLVAQQRAEEELVEFSIPPEGNIYVIGRPESFAFKEGKSGKNPFLEFLYSVGYPGRFNFLSDAPENILDYRTIIDQQTGILYTVVRDIDTDALKEDYGFIFKKKVNVYTSRYLTILCGTSTLGTWGCAEYAASPKLWRNVLSLSTLEELQGSVELLIHVKPDVSTVYNLNDSHLELIAYSFDYPSQGKRNKMQVQSVADLLKDFRGEMDRNSEIQLEKTIFPIGSLFAPRSAFNQKITPMVGKTEAEKIHDKIDSMCRNDSVEAPKPVLILGETGTGKEVVAGLIAYYWQRRLIDAGKAQKARKAKKPLYTQTNCAAIPETLADSELFGHEKGAFTGATKERAGVIKEAGYGVCFLDEFGDLELRTQPKLLRALANRQVRPVGKDEPVPIHAKIVAATNKDLIEAAEAKEFRSDLLSRFPHAQRIILKPLRERKEDIPPLIVYWLQMAFREHKANKPIPLKQVHIEDTALQFFLGYSYPANIRSLFDILGEIIPGDIFDELIASGKDEITINFEQIPEDYITNEFQELGKFEGSSNEEGVVSRIARSPHRPISVPPADKKLSEAKNKKGSKEYFTFIPESDEPWFQEELNCLKNELNQLCRSKNKVSKEDVENIVRNTGFDHVLSELKYMEKKEKEKLKDAFISIKEQSKMQKSEKCKLFKEPVWREISNDDVARLFKCDNSTASRWRNLLS